MALFESARLPLWRPGFDSRPGNVSPGTSSLKWRWPWSSLSSLYFVLLSSELRIYYTRIYIDLCEYTILVYIVTCANILYLYIYWPVRRCPWPPGCSPCVLVRPRSRWPPRCCAGRASAHSWNRWWRDPDTASPRTQRISVIRIRRILMFLGKVQVYRSDSGSIIKQK